MKGHKELQPLGEKQVQLKGTDNPKITANSIQSGVLATTA